MNTPTIKNTVPVRVPVYYILICKYAYMHTFEGTEGSVLCEKQIINGDEQSSQVQVLFFIP